jgi:hypothetical protein
MNATLLPGRVVRSVAARLDTVRASGVLSPAVLRDDRVARAGGYPADDDHAPHRDAALEWLARAQDATPDDGIARGYALVWHPYFRAAGWQASYPETTGYIIPTLYSAATLARRPALAERALRAARWEVRVQLPDGAVQGGVIGQPPSPTVFNTGQVILGWLEAYAATGDEQFAGAARRAGRFLADALGADGHWTRGTSRFAHPGATAYNTRTAWALAEAGARLDEPSFTDAAARNLHAVAALQHANGWFPRCCLYDPERPLLHTLAYATRGLLEGGRVLGDDVLLASARRAAEGIAGTVSAAGWMPGKMASDWSAGCGWSCLTGEAQMANVWLRLHEITGERAWLEPVPRVLRFLKGTQSRDADDPGLRGGIKGSAPVGGGYGRFEVLSWATKFFADALMRHDAVLRGGPSVSPLA